MSKGFGGTKGGGYNNNNNNVEKRDFPFARLGFVDEKGNLREDLMTIEAQSIANYFKKDGLTKSQLRAFFNEIKALRNKLKSSRDENKFDEIYPLILMIKSKVEYRASKRQDRNKMAGIKEFLFLGIDRIQKENKEKKGKEAFENFAIFFEVIVGYAYGLLNE